jgi:hypothetical protein
MPRLKPWDRKAEMGGVPPVNELIDGRGPSCESATPFAMHSPLPTFQLPLYSIYCRVFLQSVEIVLETPGGGDGAGKISTRNSAINE